MNPFQMVGLLLTIVLILVIHIFKRGKATI